MEEKKQRRAKSGLRGVSRFCALQMLYRSEFSDGSVVGAISGKEVEAILTESISVAEMDRKFFEELLLATEKNLAEIDAIITRNISKTWSIDRLDPVTKCILRLGISELLYFPKTPANVIFNEYIEIAKAFFDTPEVAFINGLLNKVGRTTRPTEF